jgi:hypothetical protein
MAVAVGITQHHCEEAVPGGPVPTVQAQRKLDEGGRDAECVIVCWNTIKEGDNVGHSRL